MYSRAGRLRDIAVFAAVSAVVAACGGCSYFFKEKPKPLSAIVFNGGEDQHRCLGRSFEVISRYFAGDADKGETDRIVDCAVRSLDMFVEKTRPSHSPDRYTTEQLESFVEAYFFENREMDPELMPLLFRLKASMLGGAEGEITRAEIARVRGLMVSFKEIADDLRPHMDVYALEARFTEPTAEQNRTRFDSAARALMRAARRLSEQFGTAPNRPAFSRADVKKLLMKGERTSGALRYVDLAGLLKQMLIRPPEDSIRAEDWPLTLAAGSRLYGMFLRHHYFFKDEPLPYHDDPSHLESLARESLSLVEEGLARRESGRFENVELEALVDRLAAVGLWPSRVRVASAKGLLWPLTARFLRDPRKAPPERGLVDKAPLERGLVDKARAESAFGRAELARLREAVENWLAGHRLVYAFADDPSRVYKAGELKTAFKGARLEAFAVPVWGAKAAAEARAELNELVSRGRLLGHDEEGRLWIVKKDARSGMKREDLVFLNSTRSLVRAVLRGYAHTPARSEKTAGITAKEAQELYTDLRDFGIDLDVLDSRVYTAGERGFMEANLFTSVGNGDELMTVHEGVEFFATVFSGGAVAADLQEELKAAACGAGVDDYAGYPRFRADCVRAYLRERLDKELANAPGLQSYVRGIRHDNEKWSEFIGVLEEASRTGGHSREPYEFSDLKTMIPVLLYVESIFVNCDKNADGVLSSEEIWSAFPRFRAFIRKLGNGRAESSDVQATIYSFLLTFGRPPSIGTSGKIEMGTWWIGRRFVSESANRLDILKIISSISVQARLVKLEELKVWFSGSGDGLNRKLAAGDRATTEKLTVLAGCPVTASPAVGELARLSIRAWMAPPTWEQVRLEKCGDPVMDCERAQTSGLKLPARVFGERVTATIQSDESLRRICWPNFIDNTAK